MREQCTSGSSGCHLVWLLLCSPICAIHSLLAQLPGCSFVTFTFSVCMQQVSLSHSVVKYFSRHWVLLSFCLHLVWLNWSGHILCFCVFLGCIKWDWIQEWRLFYLLLLDALLCSSDCILMWLCVLTLYWLFFCKLFAFASPDKQPPNPVKTICVQLLQRLQRKNHVWNIYIVQRWPSSVYLAHLSSGTQIIIVFFLKEVSYLEPFAVWL